MGCVAVELWMVGCVIVELMGIGCVVVELAVDRSREVQQGAVSTLQQTTFSSLVCKHLEIMPDFKFFVFSFFSFRKYLTNK